MPTQSRMVRVSRAIGNLDTTAKASGWQGEFVAPSGTLTGPFDYSKTRVHVSRNRKIQVAAAPRVWVPMDRSSFMGESNGGLREILKATVTLVWLEPHNTKAPLSPSGASRFCNVHWPPPAGHGRRIVSATPDASYPGRLILYF